MIIYIIEVEYISPMGKKIFTEVSSEAYKTLSEAMNFCKKRSDYSSSLNDHIHFGERHNYIIREINVTN